MTIRCARTITSHLHHAMAKFGTTGTVSGHARTTENAFNA
jgi:hypothetical protein